MAKRLVVIDGKSVFYRGYYAMSFLSTKDGTPTGGVYGFAALSLEVMKKLKPDYVVVAWDKAKTNIRKRREIYPEYKAGRKPAPPDFYEQIPMLQDLLKAFNWPLYELDDYEADDIMGAVAKQAGEKDIETCLITSDLDLLQVISPLTHVYALKKGFTNIDLFHPESFEKKYGIDVHQFLDLKALKGDSSDNLPGVPGIGEKTALQLLQDYKTLDGVYEHLEDIKPALRQKLENGKKTAYLTKEVARLWVDAPVKLDLKDADAHELDTSKLKALLEKFEFHSLLKQLPNHMQVGREEKIPTSDEFTKPVELTKTNESLLKEAKHLAVAIVNGQWLLSPDPKSVFYIDSKKAKEIISKKPIISHDTKAILKLLLEDSYDLPLPEHDTRIAAFILDSLIRYKELGELSGIDLTVDDGSKTIGAIWKLYKEQTVKFKKLSRLASVAQKVDFPLIPVLARMEHHGVLLDVKFLKKMSQDFQKKINELSNQIYDTVGYEFNISSPAQLSDVLFGKLALPTAGIKKGKTSYSTGAKELEKLKGQHPIIELIESYREVTKLQSTYVDALPRLVDENSRLHTTFKQDIAATGRLSSTDPNLQNIPVRSELGRKIRDGFIAGKGSVLVSADYSQFELRLAAFFSKDEAMIKAFNEDADIHQLTAAAIAGIDPKDVTKEMRYRAKAVNFGILYGQGHHGLAVGTGMSFAQAKDFIEKYFEIRPNLKTYMDSLRKKAHEEGYVETIFGRRRPTPDVKSSNYIVRSAAERAAINMPLQGTAADLTKMAMIKLDEKLGDLGQQILQIHDSILVECPEKNADGVK